MSPHDVIFVRLEILVLCCKKATLLGLILRCWRLSECYICLLLVLEAPIKNSQHYSRFYCHYSSTSVWSQSDYPPVYITLSPCMWSFRLCGHETLTEKESFWNDNVEEYVKLKIFSCKSCHCTTLNMPVKCIPSPAQSHIQPSDLRKSHVSWELVHFTYNQYQNTPLCWCDQQIYIT